MRHLTCDPKSEVRGDVLISLIRNLRADDIDPYLEHYGLHDIHADEWYSTKDFLSLMNKLSQELNQVQNYVAIGMSIAETAYMPPELAEASFAELLEGWDHHYQANHRNADIGHKIPMQVDEQHYKIIMDGIYPDDMEYGVLYGFARRFLPPGTSFTVWYDEDELPMDRGGERTVIHVRWE